MKHCPNPACPFLARMGEVAEYQDHVEQCIDCGVALVPGEAPRELAAAEKVAEKVPEKATEGQPSKLVVVAIFLQGLEAYAWRARLEAEGIPAFIADEHMGALYGFGANLTGGMRLLVPESDVELAQELLKDRDSGPSA
jgi:hypothetical protein